MRYELKSVGIWAFIKVAFFLNMIVGFVFGLFYAMFVIVVLAMATTMPFMNMPGVDPEALNPSMILIIIPLMFSFFGAIFITIFEITVLSLYNLFARFLGGLELKLEAIPLDNIATPISSTHQVAPAASLQPVAPIPPVAPATPVAPVAPVVSSPPPPPLPPLAPGSSVQAAPDYSDTKPIQTDHIFDESSDNNIPPRTPSVPDSQDEPDAPDDPVNPDAPDDPER